MRFFDKTVTTAAAVVLTAATIGMLSSARFGQRIGDWAAEKLGATPPDRRDEISSTPFKIQEPTVMGDFSTSPLSEASFSQSYSPPGRAVQYQEPSATPWTDRGLPADFFDKK